VISVPFAAVKVSFATVVINRLQRRLRS